MKALRPKSLTDLVTTRLRMEIIEGGLEFGEALSETRIAGRYGVSRTPVREAFALLDLEGLVHTEPQYGTFVFRMDRRQFDHISEARMVLERAALEFAMERDRAGLLDDWRRIVRAMTEAKDANQIKRYLNSDSEFHQTLFDRAGNPQLSEACQAISAKMAAVRNRLGANPEHTEKSFAEHLAIMDAVEAGDRQKACDLLYSHICHKGRTFWVEPEVAPPGRWERIANLTD